MLINDDECDTEYPEVLDEERLMGDDVNTPLPATLLLANVHIARLMGPLARMSRSLCITGEALIKFEAHLGDCMRLLPRPLQLTANTALDPCILPPLIAFQNTRVMLHRHNLSPSCSVEQRALAIEQCVGASRDTAAILSRCMPPHPQSHEWEQRFVLAATTLLCTHMWRCMLFLLFRQLFDGFHVLLRAAATIDDTRSVNVSCGRYIAFFVRRLTERLEQSNNLDVDQDEELLVYLSADLQASTNSWVWGNAETGTHLSRRQKHGRPKNVPIEHESHPRSTPKSPSWDNVLSDEETHDWGGWQNIERSARHLQQLFERRHFSHLNSQLPNSLPRSPLSTQNLPSTPSFPGPLPKRSTPPQPQIVPGLALAPIISRIDTPDPNRDRMTIANII
jgi:hypothetical protein